MRIQSTLTPLILLFALAGPATAQVKVFISADMEGVVGAVTDQQLGPEGFEYAKFREYMTDEVLAAIRGARAAGATEILVADAHGNGQNLLIDRLPKDVQVVRSWPRPNGMMEGIDETFHAAVFLGYHTATTNPLGVRAHTFSSATMTDVRINGKSVAESGWNATLAGHYGVPVVAISGDDAVIAEAKAFIGDLEGAIVKWAKSFHSARTLTPAAAYDVIEAAVKRGVERRGSIKPLRTKGPVSLDISFKNYRQAELLAYLPIVERIDAHSIRYKAGTILDAAKFVQFVMNYKSDITP